LTLLYSSNYSLSVIPRGPINPWLIRLIYDRQIILKLNPKMISKTPELGTATLSDDKLRYKHRREMANNVHQQSRNSDWWNPPQICRNFVSNVSNHVLLYYDDCSQNFSHTSASKGRTA